MIYKNVSGDLFKSNTQRNSTARRSREVKFEKVLSYAKTLQRATADLVIKKQNELRMSPERNNTQPDIGTTYASGEMVLKKKNQSTVESKKLRRKNQELKATPHDFYSNRSSMV